MVLAVEELTPELESKIDTAFDLIAECVRDADVEKRRQLDAALGEIIVIDQNDVEQVRVDIPSIEALICEIRDICAEAPA